MNAVRNPEENPEAAHVPRYAVGILQVETGRMPWGFSSPSVSSLWSLGVL